MLFDALEYNPVNFSEDLLKTLTIANQTRFRQSVEKHSTDAFYTTIIPSSDQKLIKSLRKPFFLPVEKELKKGLKSIAQKLELKGGVDIEKIRLMLLEDNKIKIDPIHYIPQPQDIPVIYSTIYDYVVKENGNAITEAMSVLQSNEATVTSATQFITSRHDNNTTSPLPSAPVDEQIIKKLSTLATTILLLLCPKIIIESYIWKTKVVKSLVVLSYNQTTLNEAFSLYVAKNQPDATNSTTTTTTTTVKTTKRRAKATTTPKDDTRTKFQIDHAMLFYHLFRPITLTQIASMVAGIKEVTELTEQSSLKLKQEHNKKLRAVKQAEKDENKMNDAHSDDENDNAMGDGDDDDNDFNGKNGNKKSQQDIIDAKNAQNAVVADTTGYQKHLKYVDGRFVWTPAPIDNKYALSQLRAGQVRFGIIQGIEAHGIFVDTVQNHCKVRVLVPYHAIFNLKVLTQLVETHKVVVVDEDDKSTKKMKRGITIGDDDDDGEKNNKQKKNKKNDGDIDSSGDHAPVNFKQFPKEVVMKVANKRYQIGDRVSFVITEVSFPKKKLNTSNNNKSNNKNNNNLNQSTIKQDLTPPRIFGSFSTHHFRKLAHPYAIKLTIAMKFFLFLKFLDIRAKLLKNLPLGFYPPRYYEQVQAMPIFAQLSSEFIAIDSKLLAMVQDVVSKNYASDWITAIKKNLDVKFFKSAQLSKSGNNNNNLSDNDDDDGDDNNLDDSDEDFDFDESDVTTVLNQQLQSQLFEIGVLTRQLLTNESSDDDDDDDDDDDNNMSDGDGDGKVSISDINNINGIIKPILQIIKGDHFMLKYFTNGFNKVTTHREYKNDDKYSTTQHEEYHHHNGSSYQHRHVRPGLNSALFSATNATQKSIISNHKNTDAEKSQIYLQGINLVRNLMSYQPYPLTSGYRLDTKSVAFNWTTHPQRQLDVVEFFCDKNRWEFLNFHGQKYHNYIKSINKIKSKQIRSMATAVQNSSIANLDVDVFDCGFMGDNNKVIDFNSIGDDMYELLSKVEFYFPSAPKVDAVFIGGGMQSRDNKTSTPPQQKQEKEQQPNQSHKKEQSRQPLKQQEQSKKQVESSSSSTKKHSEQTQKQLEQVKKQPLEQPKKQSEQPKKQPEQPKKQPEQPKKQPEQQKPKEQPEQQKPKEQPEQPKKQPDQQQKPKKQSTPQDFTPPTQVSDEIVHVNKKMRKKNNTSVNNDPTHQQHDIQNNKNNNNTTQKLTSKPQPTQQQKQTSTKKQVEEEFELVQLPSPTVVPQPEPSAGTNTPSGGKTPNRPKRKRAVVEDNTITETTTITNTTPLPVTINTNPISTNTPVKSRSNAKKEKAAANNNTNTNTVKIEPSTPIKSDSTQKSQPRTPKKIAQSTEKANKSGDGSIKATTHVKNTMNDDGDALESLSSCINLVENENKPKKNKNITKGKEVKSPLVPIPSSVKRRSLDDEINDLNATKATKVVANVKSVKKSKKGTNTVITTTNQ